LRPGITLLVRADAMRLWNESERARARERDSSLTKGVFLLSHRKGDLVWCDEER
jgi:hypothetical protein